jgi:hypothetical protein
MGETATTFRIADFELNGKTKTLDSRPRPNACRGRLHDGLSQCGTRSAECGRNDKSRSFAALKDDSQKKDPETSSG